MIEDRKIRLMPTFEGVTPDAVCFETRITRDEMHQWGTAFEHHGTTFDPIKSPSALRMYYERLLLGQIMPLTLILTKWWKIDQILAAALFTDPQLIHEPSMLPLVSSVEMVDRLGPVVMSYIPWEHRDVIACLRSMSKIPHEEATATDYATLVHCVHVVSEYVLNAVVPESPMPPPNVHIIAQEVGVMLLEAQDYPWIQVWGSGAVLGIWIKPDATLEVQVRSQLVRQIDTRRLPGSWESGGNGKYTCRDAMGTEVFRALCDYSSS